MVDDDEGVGFTADLVAAIERLIAAIPALLLADTLFARSCALLFAVEVVVVGGFDRTRVVVFLQVWSVGNRCWGQNCWLHSSQRIGANNTFLHLELAQRGWVDSFVFPVITGHSFVMCWSIGTLGSCPTGIVMGVLHNGQDGATRLCLSSSYLSHS